MKKLTPIRIMFGCDPEFFFRKDNEVVGAEKVLPLSGLMVNGTESSKIIIDGVQAELNPQPTNCREVLASILTATFTTLSKHMQQFERLQIDFSQTIKLSDDDFERLSDDSKKFGCMPSKNASKGGKVGAIKINPATYRYRSAGGHIHIGTDADYPSIKNVLADPVRVVKMLDILVGNTCVLIDRDAGNIERRKVYGKAGEFRTPPHGLEYRTLSNFWLRSYQLMSLVFGLVRHAVNIVADDMDGEFLKLVDMDAIERAINTNDFSLALKNFKKIEKLLLEVTPDYYGWFPIHANIMTQFKHFVKKGTDHWFEEDAMNHWVHLNDHERVGFSDFLETTVNEDMKRSKLLS